MSGLFGGGGNFIQPTSKLVKKTIKTLKPKDKPKPKGKGEPLNKKSDGDKEKRKRKQRAKPVTILDDEKFGG